MKISINKDLDLSFEEFKKAVGHKFNRFVDGNERLKAEYTRLTGNKATQARKEKREKKSDQDKVSGQFDLDQQEEKEE